MTRPLRALDLFAGAGGLSVGLQAAGIQVVAAVENDASAALTYRKNHFGVPILEADVSNLRSEDLLAAASGDIDLVVGGPPCQGFSMHGRRDPSHPSTELLFEFVRVVEELQPVAFLIENVPGLLSFGRGIVIDRLIRRLNRIRIGGARYTVVLDTLDAADFGVPQHRKRVFICGVIGDVYQFPHGSPERVSLFEAIGDLPELTAELAEPPDDTMLLPPMRALTQYQRARRKRTRYLYNHSAKRVEELRARRIALLREGDDRRALPAELQTGGREGKYRKLLSGAPAPTIVANMARDTSPFIHPRYDRMLTVREAARLQSFDDTFRFWGSQYQQFRQVGNAVPPLLAAALARKLATVAESRRRSMHHGPKDEPLQRAATA